MILRSAKLSEQLKRDGQHETPQAPPSGGSQSAPTARALRLERRNAAKLKAQASTIEKYNIPKKRELQCVLGKVRPQPDANPHRI